MIKIKIIQDDYPVVYHYDDVPINIAKSIKCLLDGLVDSDHNEMVSSESETE